MYSWHVDFKCLYHHHHLAVTVQTVKTARPYFLVQMENL